MNVTLTRVPSTPIDLAELVPKLADVRHARALVAEQLADARQGADQQRAATSPTELGRHIADAARRGERSPVDLASVLAGQRTAMDVSGEVLEALNTADAVLSQDEEATILRHLDEALAALHDRLGGVLANVHDLVPALGTVRSAEDAVQAGADAVSAYTNARNLLGQYTAIRQTQRALISYGWRERTAFVGVLRIAGEFANLDDIWPCWAKALTSNGYLDATNNTYTTPPWPDDADPFEPRYSLAYLLWIAEPANPARVWVPTRPQLGKAFNAAHAAVDRRERTAEQSSGRGYVPTEYVPTQV